MQRLKEKKLFLLDMDGTLYLDDDLFPCTIPFLNAIKENGGRYLFLTNNSSKSVRVYIEKLERLGIPATEEDFFTSTMATCVYLQEHYHGKKIYAAGTAAFTGFFADYGFYGCFGFHKSLSVGVEGNKFNALDFAYYHVVNCVTAAAADADNFYIDNTTGFIIHVKIHLHI